jgi:hypothetical protein
VQKTQSRYNEGSSEQASWRWSAQQTGRAMKARPKLQADRVRSKTEKGFFG